MRIRFGLGAMLAILAVSCVSVASAAAPIEASNTKTINSESPGGFLKPVDARCPSGRFPVSGGFELLTDGADLAFPQGEGVDLTGKLWSLAMFPIGNARVTAFAYCSPLGRRIEFRSDRTDLDSAGDAASVTATCKKDEEVFSGGYAFVSSGDAIGLNQQSFRQGKRSWTIKAINLSENPITVLAFAYCGDEKVPSVTTVKKSVPYVDNGLVTATAKCPKSRYALSGGYKDPASTGGVIALSHRKGTRSWTAAEGGINGRDDKFTAFAYCAKK